jgi:hypothetical protein
MIKRDNQHLDLLTTCDNDAVLKDRWTHNRRMLTLFESWKSKFKMNNSRACECF